MNFHTGKIQRPPMGMGKLSTPDPKGRYNKKLISEGNSPVVKKASLPKKSRFLDNLKIASITGRIARTSAMPVTLMATMGYMNAKRQKSPTPFVDALDQGAQGITVPVGPTGINVGQFNEEVLKNRDVEKRSLNKSLFSKNVEPQERDHIPLLRKYNRKEE